MRQDDYPVMNERQVAFRWKLSVKTLRKWRATGEGTRWHKLFNLVRYHKADVIEFERRGAQFWTTILNDDERVPTVVTRPPKDNPDPAEGNAESFFMTIKDVIEATGLPRFWFTDPKSRAAKRIPHVTLIGNVRYSLDAIWAWETEHSIVGMPPEPKPVPAEELPVVTPAPAPRWYELAHAMKAEQFDSRQPSE